MLLLKAFHTGISYAKHRKHTWISAISGILAPINAQGTELFTFRAQTITCRNGEKGKVARCDQKEHEFSDIPGVFLSPNYITENINGDVCVSDLFRRALTVTDKFNEVRFSYGEKKEAWFSSNAVVTDIRGHIVVCDGYENTVYLLDSDGQFLRIFPQAKDRFVVPEVYTLISRTTYSLETSKMILLSYTSI